MADLRRIQLFALPPFTPGYNLYKKESYTDVSRNQSVTYGMYENPKTNYYGSKAGPQRQALRVMRRQEFAQDPNTTAESKSLGKNEEIRGLTPIMMVSKEWRSLIKEQKRSLIKRVLPWRYFQFNANSNQMIGNKGFYVQGFFELPQDNTPQGYDSNRYRPMYIELKSAISWQQTNLNNSLPVTMLLAQVKNRFVDFVDTSSFWMNVGNNTAPLANLQSDLEKYVTILWKQTVLLTNRCSPCFGRTFTARIDAIDVQPLFFDSEANERKCIKNPLVAFYIAGASSTSPNALVIKSTIGFEFITQ